MLRRLSGVTESDIQNVVTRRKGEEKSLNGDTCASLTLQRFILTSCCFSRPGSEGESLLQDTGRYKPPDRGDNTSPYTLLTNLLGYVVPYRRPE